MKQKIVDCYCSQSVRLFFCPCFQANFHIFLLFQLISTKITFIDSSWFILAMKNIFIDVRTQINKIYDMMKPNFSWICFRTTSGGPLFALWVQGTQGGKILMELTHKRTDYWKCLLELTHKQTDYWKYLLELTHKWTYYRITCFIIQIATNMLLHL